MAENEKNLAQQLFGQERSMGAMEAAGLGIAIGVAALFKGLGKVAEGAVDVVYGETTQHFVEHGAHELAAALFGNGHAFVMCPHAGKENEMSGPEQQQERGRRGM